MFFQLLFTYNVNKEVKECFADAMNLNVEVPDLA